MLIEEITRRAQVLTEGVRITHIEDTVLERGVDGALFAIQQLEQLIANSPESKKYLTVKYDGKPAVVLGRDENGQLLFTDKPRFVARGYNGRARSPEELQNVLISRMPADATPEQIADRRSYAQGLSVFWNVLEEAIPQDFRGYILGDLMWSPGLSRLSTVGDYYVFEPNTVRYRVGKNTAIGQQITAAGAGRSVGIAIHQYLPLDSETPKLLDRIPNYNKKSGLVLFLSEYPGQPELSLETEKLEMLKKQINTPANRAALNSLLDPASLSQMRITDFPGQLQSYVNSRVDAGNFRDIAAGFFPWLDTNAKISDSKKENIQHHIEMHQAAYGLLFKIFIALVYFKESLLQQLNSGQQTFDASINDSPGGEGYVYGEGDDKIKLVRRFEFSRANREKYRK
jgi:hypothetical protein